MCGTGPQEVTKVIQTLGKWSLHLVIVSSAFANTWCLHVCQLHVKWSTCCARYLPDTVAPRSNLVDFCFGGCLESAINGMVLLRAYAPCTLAGSARWHTILFVFHTKCNTPQQQKHFSLPTQRLPTQRLPQGQHVYSGPGRCPRIAKNPHEEHPTSTT